MKSSITFFVLLLLIFNTTEAQELSESNPKKVYVTKKVNDNRVPIIDGKINDESWDDVEWQGDFIELRPDENTPPSHQTRFKVLYDNKNLYIAIQAFDDEPEKIEKRLARRDWFPGDLLEINIDSYHDLRTGFSFTVSASGVIGDEFISENGRNWDTSWNPIWYSKTNIDEEGWTAEIKIPFSQIRFGKSKEQIWGFQVMRHYFREEERSVWQRVPQNSPGYVSEFGELHGLVDIEPQKQLEIQPYTTSQLETFPAEPNNPYRDGDDFKLNAGVDGKIGITNDLTLDFTINPDFGQVEADPAAIALDGFQIFFREQRPFFVENKNIFDYRFANGFDNVFYSRRIGRNPQGYPNTTNGEFVDQPQNTTILGAAKFSGKTKNGWSIGVLESLTSREFAEIDNNGDRRKELVEPLTNYFVGRLQKDFNDRNTYIGGIFTATNRAELPEQLDFLHKAAYTGGLDFKHQWKDRKFYAEGNVLFSHVQGSKEAIAGTQNSITHLFQRVDADHVEVDPNRTSLTGTGGRIEVGKAGGGHWRYDAGFVWRSPELELNDIGFLRQADEFLQFFNVRYSSIKPSNWFRRASIGFSQFSTFDFDGNYNRQQYEINANANLKNNWWINVGTSYKPRVFSNTALRGGPRWRFSDENFGYLFVQTDSRKKLRFNAGLRVSGTEQNNSSLFYTEVGVVYQPIDALQISLNPEYSSNPNKTQYVTETDFTGTPRYILADIDNKTISASVRLNYNVNPNLTIQYYGQPFVSRGRYTNFKYVTNPVANNLNDRFHVYNDNQISFNNTEGYYNIDENTDGTSDYNIGNPDFTFVQFRSNLVVRWEYIRGSELFLVWSQGVTGSGNPSENLFRSLDNQILKQQPENIFLIKATYRFML